MAMQKINDLFGKRVINQATGDSIATVRDVVLSSDARSIIALVIDGGRSAPNQVVRWNAVVSIGEFVIVDGTRPFMVIDEDTEVTELRQSSEQITGKTIISATGEKVGVVGDILFDPRGQLVGYTLKQGMFNNSQEAQILPAEYIRAIGKDAIIAESADLRSLSAFESSAAESGDVRERMRGDEAYRSDTRTTLNDPYAE